jgi:hypothetical protein
VSTRIKIDNDELECSGSPDFFNWALVEFLELREILARKLRDHRASEERKGLLKEQFNLANEMTVLKAKIKANNDMLNGRSPL